MEEFRELSRSKLKRTFVSGSDAANSKVNRLNSGVKRSNPESESEEGVSKKVTDEVTEHCNKIVPLANKSILPYGNFVKSSAPPQVSQNEGFILPPKNPSSRINEEVLNTQFNHKSNFLIIIN